MTSRASWWGRSGGADERSWETVVSVLRKDRWIKGRRVLSDHHAIISKWENKNKSTVKCLAFRPYFYFEITSILWLPFSCQLT